MSKNEGRRSEYKEATLVPTTNQLHYSRLGRRMEEVREIWLQNTAELSKRKTLSKVTAPKKGKVKKQNQWKSQTQYPSALCHISEREGMMVLLLTKMFSIPLLSNLLTLSLSPSLLPISFS